MGTASATTGDIDRVQSFLAPVKVFPGKRTLTETQADALLRPGNVLRLSVTWR